MKTYNIKNGITSEAKSEINRIINTHEKYKGAFFFRPSSNASGRRSNEQRFAANNPDIEFDTKKGLLAVSMTYSESCNNVYYHIYITINGKKTNITSIKNLLK